MRRLIRWPAFPILLAVYPVLNLYAVNASQVPFDSTLRVLGARILAATVLLLLTWLVSRDLVAAALFVAVFATFFFGYAHVYRMLIETGARTLGPEAAYAVFRHRYLVPAWTGLFLFSALLIWKAPKGKWRSAGTPYLNLVAVALVVMPALRVASLQTGSGDIYAFGSRGTKALVGFAEIQPTLKPAIFPEIYYIILDAYGSEAVLKRRFDYDNSEFMEFLTSKGFYVASASSANYPATLYSLASSLNMEYLDRFAHWKYDDFARSIEMNRLERFLKSIGYVTVRFPTFWYPTRLAGAADIQFRARTDRLDEFTELFIRTRMLDRLVDVQGISARDHTLYVFEKLGDMPLLERRPLFVFAHILVPRPPYIFDRNGDPRKNREGGADDGRFDEKEPYVEQVIFVNKMMRRIVERLLSRPDRRPIVVIQGDHGPPNYGGRDARVYFGLLNAYYLPDGGAKRLYSSITPVNSFRIILDHYFATRLGLLEDRSYFVDRPSRALRFRPAPSDAE